MENFKQGDKVVYQVEGPLDWEEIDEANQDGLTVGKDYTIREVDIKHRAVTVEEGILGIWISNKHFKLKTI